MGMVVMAVMEQGETHLSKVKDVALFLSIGRAVFVPA